MTAGAFPAVDPPGVDPEPTLQETTMKQFACGDVVPGCGRVFRGTEDQILLDVAAHARHDHGIVTVPDSMVAAVRAGMRVAV